MLAVAIGLLGVLAGCISMPPLTMSPFYKTQPNAQMKLEATSWLADAKPGDRYAVAGDDLEWRDETFIGPADDRTGRCAVTPTGEVRVRAPKTPGEWPCLLRACRDTCIVARLTLVVEATPPPRAE